MTVTLRNRFDITLEAVRRVAWEGEPVTIAAAALAVMDGAHESFRRMVEARQAQDPAALIYGVTTGPGDSGKKVLSPEAAANRPSRMHTAASFGEPLPDRVTRAVALARLANFVEGHATARAELGLAMAEMLDGRPMPMVPGEANGGAGEILPLGHLYDELSQRVALTPKEGMALINGSPCSAALIADLALAGGARTQLAEEVFALTAEALNVALEAYSADLEPLWNDVHETAALRALRHNLAGGSAERQPHQSTVSFRILPRVLGQLRRAQAEAERAATVSLSSVTDNPVYILPDAERPLGTIFSTGGYHNAQAPAAIDGLTFAWSDVCQLAQLHSNRLFQDPMTSQLDVEFSYKPIKMVANGWAEEARMVSLPTLLSTGAFGQNDTPILTFLAWRKADRAGYCLENSLAVIASLAVQAMDLGGRPVPPALRPLADIVRRNFPTVTGTYPLGPGLAAVAAAFRRRVFAGRVAGAAG